MLDEMACEVILHFPLMQIACVVLLLKLHYGGVHYVSHSFNIKMVNSAIRDLLS